MARIKLKNRHSGWWLSDDGMEMQKRDSDYKRNDDHLTFDALEDGTITLSKNGSPTAITCQYSMDGGNNWIPYTVGKELPLKKGDEIKFKSITTALSSSSSNYYQFIIPKRMDVRGNIKSMLYTNTTPPAYAFHKLFAECKIVRADLLNIPFKVMSNYTCACMFMNCTELITPPELPATDSNTYCYWQMFYNCKSLQTAPDLPIKNLRDCCYNMMFYGCTLINSVKMLANGYFSSTNVFNDWLKNVAPVGTLYKLSTFNLASTHIPSGWNVVDIDTEEMIFMEIGSTRNISGFSGTAEIISYDKPSFFTISSNGSITLSKTPTIANGTFTVIIRRNGYADDTRIISYICIENCLKFTATQANSSIGFGHAGTAFTTSNRFYYSTDEGVTWTEYANPYQTVYTSCMMISLPHVGDSVFIRGIAEAFSATETNHYRFRMTGKIEASGNIMSLMNFRKSAVSYCFYELFMDCDSLTTAPEIPATTLATYCYMKMFMNCTSLVEPPLLQATTIQNYCYDSMFAGCTSLIKAPELPCTGLREGCYRMMFCDCTSITDFIDLPATSLAVKCYQGMFKNCTSLTRDNVDIYLRSTTLQNYCYDEMFAGCTSLRTIHYIAGAELRTGSCTRMFQGCTQLRSVSVGFTSWLSGATTDWLDGVASDGTFWKNSHALPNTRGASNIPTTWNTTGSGVVATIQADFNGSLNIASYITATGSTLTCSSLPSGLTLSGTTLTGTISDDVEFPMVLTTSKTVTNLTVKLHPITTADALKFTALQANSKIRFHKQGSPTAITCQYSLDNGSTWNTYAVTSNSTELTLANVGDTVMFKCTSSTLSSSTSNYYRFVMNAGQFKVTGNIISLCNFNTVCTASYQYYYLFYGCTRLVSAKIQLPTKYTTSCLGALFYGCTSLIEPPELPVTSLQGYCYQSMFQGCTSLVTPPELPATNVPAYAYSSMFYGCTALTTAPALPAITLNVYCYYQMFYLCSSLTTAPKLTSTIMSTYCYEFMFCGCTSLTTAPELPSMVLLTSCYQGMFAGCTSLVNAPYLIATALTTGCYRSMFVGCTSLKLVKTNMNTFNISNMGGMVQNVADNGCLVLMNRSCTPVFNDTHGVPSNWYCEDANGNVLGYGWNKTVEIGLMEGETINHQLVCGHKDGDTIVFEAVNPPSGINVSSSGLITGSYDSEALFYVNIKINGELKRKTTIVINQGAIADCLKITNVHTSASNVKISKTKFPRLIDIKYSLDNGSTWDAFTYGTNVSIPKNGEMLIRNKSNYFNQMIDCYFNFTCTGKISISGNIKSLLNFSREMHNAFTFTRLFTGNSILYSSKNLILPYMTIPYCGYYYAFYGCYAMIDAPELPAINIESYAYSYMFQNCKALTTTPALPAKTMTFNAYSGMFSDCTALTTISPISATVLASYCYSNMFNGCTSLTTAPELPAKIPVDATYCYYQMFSGCTNLVNPPSILPSKELATFCYSQMFNGCTKLARMPELPATDGKQNCYSAMFYNCKALTETTNISLTASIINSHLNMFYGCSALTKIRTDLTAINTTYMKDWVNGVSATGTFIAPENLSVSRGVSAVPTGWTVKRKPRVIASNNHFVFTPDIHSFSLNCTCSSSTLTYSSNDIPPEFSLNSNGTVTNVSAVENKRYSFHVTATPADTDLDSVTFQVFVMYRSDILRFTAKQDSTIGFGAYSSVFTCDNSFYYSLDDGVTWTQYSNPSGTKYTTCAMISVSNGEDILFRGITSNFGRSSDICFTFRMTGKFDVSGNIMSLLNFVDEIPTKYCFAFLFYNCKALNSAENLVLPSTVLTDNCYRSLFNISGLTKPPAILPATQSKPYCYYGMFYNISTLTTAPQIMLEITSDYCLANMFYGCTNLEDSIELRFTTVSTYCCQTMFYNCLKLTGLTVWLDNWTTTNVSNGTTNWVQGITNSTGVFTIKSSTLTVVRGNNRIPTNWTVVRE